MWDASGVSLTLLYKLSTSQMYVSEDLGGEGASAEDDDWPPFRKVSCRELRITFEKE